MEYIIGKVMYVNKSYTIIENNFIGYKIFINDSLSFEKDLTYRFYVYEKLMLTSKNNFVKELYGFKSPTQKIFFEQLISIAGIGPKTALTILKTNVDELKLLIKTKDYKTLETLPGFNKKIVWQVINDLAFKLTLESSNDKENDNNQNKPETSSIGDLVSALKALGYKKDDVEFALSELPKKIKDYQKLELSDLISETIKIIVGNDEYNTTKAN